MFSSTEFVRKIIIFFCSFLSEKLKKSRTFHSVFTLWKFLKLASDRFALQKKSFTIYPRIIIIMIFFSSLRHSDDMLARMWAIILEGGKGCKRRWTSRQRWRETAPGNLPHSPLFLPQRAIRRPDCQGPHARWPWTRSPKLYFCPSFYESINHHDFSSFKIDFYDSKTLFNENCGRPWKKYGEN